MMQKLHLKIINSQYHKWFVLATAMIAAFMSVLDNTIVNIALNDMIKIFHTSIDGIKWVVTAYGISFALTTFSTVWLKDVLGRKNLFIVSVVIFTVSSFFCGISFNVAFIVFFRILQGIGAGLLMPTAFTLITESFPPQQRGSAFGFFGLVIVFAPTIGPTLGGYLVDKVSWRWIFFINIPVGIFAVFFSLVSLKNYKTNNNLIFDFKGFLFLSIFILCLLLIFSEAPKIGWISKQVVLLAIISFVSFLYFIIFEKNCAQPILDLSLFKSFNFIIITFANFNRAVVLFGRMFLMSIFLQKISHYSALKTGFILVPGAVVSGISMPFFGRLTDKFGGKIFIIIGLILLAVSNFLYKDLVFNSSLQFIIFSMIIFGLGMGILNAPLNSTAMNVVKKEQIAMVSALLVVIMQLGGAFGVAILGTFIKAKQVFYNNLLEVNNLKLLSENLAYNDAFIFLFLFGLLAIILSLFLNVKKEVN